MAEPENKKMDIQAMASELAARALETIRPWAKKLGEAFTTPTDKYVADVIPPALKDTTVQKLLTTPTRNYIRGERGEAQAHPTKGQQAEPEQATQQKSPAIPAISATVSGGIETSGPAGAPSGPAAKRVGHQIG